MSGTPVLIIAFNRPQKLKQLILSLRSSRPPIMMIAVDGPRSTHPEDATLVQETQNMISEIEWPCTVMTRFREENMGLQSAYVDAVNWAMSEFGETIVIEDDVVVGPELYDFLHHNLDQFRHDKSVGQINGYNFAPPGVLSAPSNSRRMTKYPTSYCWASWSRSWNFLDLSIHWGRSISVRELATHTGDRLSAIMWKLNFQNAVTGRVNTWDYAWVASLWEHDLKIVSPNRNLCLYNGFDDGTHTRRNTDNRQLEIASLHDLEDSFPEEIDKKADLWQRKKIYKETPIGLVEKSAASIVLDAEKRRHAKKSKR